MLTDEEFERDMAASDEATMWFSAGACMTERASDEAVEQMLAQYRAARRRIIADRDALKAECERLKGAARAAFLALTDEEFEQRVSNGISRLEAAEKVCEAAVDHIEHQHRRTSVYHAPLLAAISEWEKEVNHGAKEVHPEATESEQQ